jgi:hypothetical protein
MPIWTRDICGSSFSFDEWGVNVTSLVKPDKYAALSDGEHWTQVADFECAGIAGLCSFIKENYTTSEEPLGEDILQAFGINGQITYNTDLSVSVSLPDYSPAERDAIQAWADTELGQGKVVVGG